VAAHAAPPFCHRPPFRRYAASLIDPNPRQTSNQNPTSTSPQLWCAIHARHGQKSRHIHVQQENGKKRTGCTGSGGSRQEGRHSRTGLQGHKTPHPRPISPVFYKQRRVGKQTAQETKVARAAGRNARQGRLLPPNEKKGIEKAETVMPGVCCFISAEWSRHANNRLNVSIGGMCCGRQRQEIGRPPRGNSTSRPPVRRHESLMAQNRRQHIYVSRRHTRKVNKAGDIICRIEYDTVADSGRTAISRREWQRNGGQRTRISPHR